MMAEALCSHWFMAWQRHMQAAHQNTQQSEGYQRAALITQAYYVMFHALESWK